MGLPEEELPVEVCEIDCIEINDVNVEETSKGQILQELTSEAARADNQDSDHFLEKSPSF